MRRIVSISVSKVFNKTSITIVSYGDVPVPVSDKLILISKTEENGIYTKTYIYEDTRDLELAIERDIENITEDFYLRTMYRKIARKGGSFSYKRERIIGSPVALANVSHKPLVSKSITLRDILGYAGGIPIEEKIEYLIEYGRDIEGKAEMCGGEYKRVESKRVVVKNYDIFPKVNFKKCNVKTKTVSVSIPEGSISVTYTVNAVCNVHRIERVYIRKNGSLKPIANPSLK